MARVLCVLSFSALALMLVGFEGVVAENQCSMLNEPILWVQCQHYEVAIGELGEDFIDAQNELEKITKEIKDLSDYYFDEGCHNEQEVEDKYDALVVRYATAKGHMEGHKTEIDEYEARMKQDGCFECFEMDIHSNNVLYSQFKAWWKEHPCEVIDSAVGLGATVVDTAMKFLEPQLAVAFAASQPFCSAVKYVKDGTVNVGTGQALPWDLNGVVQRLVEWGVDTAVANKVHEALQFTMTNVQDKVCPVFFDSFEKAELQCNEDMVYLQQLCFAVLDAFCGDVAQAMWKIFRPVTLCNVDNPAGSNTCGEELDLACHLFPNWSNAADDPSEGELVEFEFYPQTNTAVRGKSVEVDGKVVILFRSDFCNDAKYLSSCQKKCESIKDCVGFVDDYSTSDRRCVLKVSAEGTRRTNKTLYTKEKNGCGAYQWRKYCKSDNLKTYNIGEKNLPENAIVDYETCGALEGDAFTTCCHRFCESQMKSGCCFANDYQTNNVVLGESRTGNLRTLLAVSEPRRQCAFLPDTLVSTEDIPKANVGRHAKFAAACF